MSMSRRSLLGGVTLTSASAVLPRAMLAQDAGTPVAGSDQAGTPEAVAVPGYAIARVRVLPTAELNQAIFPNVMHQYLPQIQAVPGFTGYVFGFDSADPAASISLHFMTDADAAAATEDVSAGYVASLDARFAVETPLADSGPLRVFGVTDRPSSELPPFLHGAAVTSRQRQTAPGADIEAVVTQATEELLPMLAAMEGFVLYAWIQTETGRTAINIWETAEQMAAGDQAVADYVAQNTISTTVGEPIVHSGTVGYAFGIV